jgi:hypothetical protein
MRRRNHFPVPPKPIAPHRSVDAGSEVRAHSIAIELAARSSGTTVHCFIAGRQAAAMISNAQQCRQVR